TPTAPAAAWSSRSAASDGPGTAGRRVWRRWTASPRPRPWSCASAEPCATVFSPGRRTPRSDGRGRCRGAGVRLTGPMTAVRAPAGMDISVRGLSKDFGSFRAVDDLTFEVAPGRVTGFLGPNGAGKTTTLRMLLGLVRPTSGEALIGGRRYAALPRPVETVGAALEATGFHPGRSGRNHLRVLAATHDIPDRRVDELLDLVGIPAAARKRAGDYSMGMRQRLGLATALLGDP